MICVLGNIPGDISGTSGSLKSPNSVVIDERLVTVADRGNQRLLLLDKNLKLIRVLLNTENSYLNFPFRICADDKDGRLLVGHRSGVEVYQTRVRQR